MAKLKFQDYDHYIELAEPFAQPILRYLRDLVNETCPGIQEDLKWNMPCFGYKGSILCTIAGFKNHVSFGFWLGPVMEDSEAVFVTDGDSGMGQFGKITCIEDLPEKSILKAYLIEAMRLTDAGVKLPSSTTGKKTKVLPIPTYLTERLKTNSKALATFENFSQSKQNDYVEWITGAKTEPTRERRMAQMLEWLEEGKSRNWKYEKS